MQDMMLAGAEKTQDTEKKLGKLSDYVSTLISDRIILKTKMESIKNILVSKTDIKINDLLREINHALKLVDHQDDNISRHSGNH